MAVLKSIAEVNKRFPAGVPLLDPVKDMKIGDKEFKQVINKIGTFEKRLMVHPLHSRADLPGLLEQYRGKAKVRIGFLLSGNRMWVSQVEGELKAAKETLRKSKSLLQMEELKNMKRVLRRLGYCTPSDVIEIKVKCSL
jgi:ATP-dependent RNA helicase DOB1